jgi:hypothetical protein
MSLFKNLKIFGKKKEKPLSRNELSMLLQKSLEPYMQREDVKAYLKEIQRDERKRKIWDGLSNRTKLRLLRYLVNKKEKQNAKL